VDRSSNSHHRKPDAGRGRSSLCLLLLAFSLVGILAAAEPPEAEAPEAEAPESRDAADPPPKAQSDDRTVLLPEPPRRLWKGERISLSLRDADLREVLRSFAKLAQVNMIIDPKVEGKVTLEFRDVPWDQALYVICKTHGLGIDVVGDNLWTMAPARELLREP